MQTTELRDANPRFAVIAAVIGPYLTFLLDVFVVVFNVILIADTADMFVEKNNNKGN